MILQYKGFNNNWTYEEADTITYAVVGIVEVTKKYRRDGSTDSEYELKRVKMMHDDVDKFIDQETHCGDEIIYHIDKPFSEMDNVTVVMLRDKNKNITRVFDKGVYLLNNKGQTVQRLA